MPQCLLGEIDVNGACPVACMARVVLVQGHAPLLLMHDVACVCLLCTQVLDACVKYWSYALLLFQHAVLSFTIDLFKWVSLNSRVPSWGLALLFDVLVVLER